MRGKWDALAEKKFFQFFTFGLDWEMEQFKGDTYIGDKAFVVERSMSDAQALEELDTQTVCIEILKIRWPIISAVRSRWVIVAVNESGKENMFFDVE